MTSVSSLSLSWPGHAAAARSGVNQTVACLPHHWGVGGVLPVGVTMSLIPPPHSRLSLVNNSSDIPLETLWHYGCPSVLVWVGILLANKGINSQGILGISFFFFFEGDCFLIHSAKWISDAAFMDCVSQNHVQPPSEVQWDREECKNSCFLKKNVSSWNLLLFVLPSFIHSFFFILKWPAAVTLNVFVTTDGIHFHRPDGLNHSIQERPVD